MSKERKIKAILNFANNAEPEKTGILFVEENDAGEEIKTEFWDDPESDDLLKISINTKDYENTKKNLIEIVKRLQND